LSFYGWTRTQDFAASILRPNPEDKNVSPHELVDFVNEQTDVMALQRIGGDLDVLRTLVANEFPVIVEVGGNLFEAYEWIGHYLTVAGYDDQQGAFYVYDSFLGGENGGSRIEPYYSLDETWKAFNRTFIVIYEPWREALLMEILGDLADADHAAEIAFEVAQQSARADRDDAFAWFNMGTALTRLGRYEEAAAAFDQATRAGMPWRTMWYQFEPFEAYFNIGDYDSVLLYVENNLNNGGIYVEETHYWRGRVFEAQGRTAEARSAFREALRRNRNFEAAEVALDRLSS
jgi:tetratricopeptide (TPR) repeat protein